MQENQITEENTNVEGVEQDIGQVQISPQPLSRSQKIAVAVLAFFAFFVIIVWMISFKKNLAGPLPKSTQITDASIDIENQSNQDLSQKDTDGDGLNDYEELNIYKTSPYLEDSDSDGFSDKEELDSDNDPNCPVGRDCIGNLEQAEKEEILPQGNGQAIVPEISQQNLNTLQNQSSQEDINKALSGQMDAASLRKVLIESGMDQNVLNQISDEDLMKSYQETLNKQ